MGSGDNQEVCEEQPKPSDITSLNNQMLKINLLVTTEFFKNKLQQLNKTQEIEPLNSTNLDDF